MANCIGCGSQWDKRQTAPVGSFPPNRFGLYDMVGNVAVWTEDCIHNNYNGAPTDGSAWIAGGDCYNPVVRGANWLAPTYFLYSAVRNSFPFNFRGNIVGFRVARTLATTPSPVNVESNTPGQSATQTSAPTLKIAGNYNDAGTNPDGTSYAGTVVITSEGGNAYSVSWQVGNSASSGTGVLNGNTLTVDWGQSSPVIYQVGADGVLRGTWDDGRATEILTPR
jgi:hypothetical protein